MLYRNKETNKTVEVIEGTKLPKHLYEAVDAKAEAAAKAKEEKAKADAEKKETEAKAKEAEAAAKESQKKDSTK